MRAETTLLLAHTVSPEHSRALVPALESHLPADAIENAVTPAETERHLPDAEMLAVGRLEESWLESDRLELVQTLWAGVDLYPAAAIERADVALANAAGVHARPIAEQVLGYALAFERGLLDAVEQRDRGVWESIRGGELGTKTVGIVGVGSIGERVAELASAFGAETVGTKRDVSSAPGVLDEVLPAEKYRTVIQRADYLVLSCPLTAETEGLIGGDELRLLGSDGVLVNVARGEIVDQTALVRALQYGVIRGAALDVFEAEPLPSDSVLWELSNVIVTPHMAWTSPETTARWAALLAENYRAVEAGDLESVVNRVW